MNVFDKQMSDSGLAGLGDIDGLGKLKVFKKIKKAVKKVAKKVAKTAVKVATAPVKTVAKVTAAPVKIAVKAIKKAPLPVLAVSPALTAVKAIVDPKGTKKDVEKTVKKVVKVGKSVEKFSKTPIGKTVIKTAAIAGATLLAGPAGGGAISAAMGGSVGKLAKTIGTSSAKNIVSAAGQLVNDPTFRATVSGMKSAGVKPDAIQSQWANSDTYAKLALNTIKQTVQPMIQSDLESRGVPSRTAAKTAAAQSEYIANDTVDEIQDKAKSTFNPMILAPLAIIPFLLR